MIYCYHMKLLILLLSLAVINFSIAQQNTCIDANAFCSSNQYDFPNATSGSAPVGPDYGCLGSEPNPIWYYMEIGTSGTVDILLQQTTGANGSGSTIDVDFAMWGPFTSLVAGCNSIMTGNLPPIQCSYSASYSEDLGLGIEGGSGSGVSTPPAAVSGQVYIVLITNYNGSAGYITFNQVGGTGSADCSIVEPCVINNFTATVSACNPATDQYSITGNIVISNPPETGQLIVQACDGTQSVVATAPFTSTNYSYNLAGLDANGLNCSINVLFTEGSCSQIINFTAPQCPPGCAFTSISGNMGSCESGSVYDLTGVLAFENQPSTGQLIVQDCNGNMQTFNPPFVSPLNITLNNVEADGQNCNLTATFTADPTCTITLNYQNTQPCDCDVAIGSFSMSTAGNASNNSTVLCFGDQITFNNNVGFVPPNEALSPPNAGGYQPGIGWLVYSCPPTVGLTYQADQDVAADPCLVTYIAGPNFNDVNDMYWINALPPGTFTNNTVYFVPITFYNLAEGLYTYTNGTLPCYEMGDVTPVQFLPQITRTVTSNCQAGTVSVQVQGGAPAVNGSQFTATNLLPANASFVNNTTANGGTIVVQGLTNGQNYSFTIEDQNGCPISITGTFTGVTASGFSYAQAAYCKGTANPSPTLTGVAGGTYSGSPGLVVNAITGVVNIAATPVGTHTVTYTSPGAPCNSQSTFVITINPLPVVTAANVAVCNGTVANLSASGANTYSWAPATGLNATTGANVQANLTANQTYTITGTSAQGCVGTGNVTVTVNPNPVPVILGPTQHCQGTPATLQTTQTFTSYNWSTGSSTQSTQATAANSPVSVTVTNAQGCTGTSVGHVLIQNPTFNTTSSVTICQGQTAMIHGVSRNTAGNYTFNGLSVLGCDSTSVVTLIVNPLPTVNAGANQNICDGTAVLLNATGNGTIVWTPTLTNNVPFIQAVGSQTYTATATDVNGCVNTSTTTVVVNPNPTPVITGQVEYCASSPATIQTSQTFTTYSWTTGSTLQSTQATVANNPIQVTVTNQFGCSGTSPAYNVIENVLITTNGSVEICQGQSAVIHGVTRTTAGVYTNVSPSVTGCDSTSNITLIVHALPILTHTQNQVVCEGTPITVTASGAPTLVWAPVITNGVAFTQPVGTQVYGLTGTSEHGCVSTSQLSVTVNPNPTPVISAPSAYCDGQSVTVQVNQAFNGYNWTTGATTPTTQATIANNPIQVTVTNSFGCSATSNALNLLQNPVLNTTGTVTICQGQNAVIHGQVQTVAGTYSNTVPSVLGCDSTSVITLIVNPLPVLTINPVPDACEGEPVTLFATGAPTLVWSANQINGVEFLQAVGTQTYTVTGTDANGCVSTAQTQIVVKPLPILTAVQNMIVCNNAPSQVVNFTSSLAGTTYSWLNDTPAIGLTSVGNGNISSFTALNNGTTPIVATITVIPTANACEGSPITFTITVQPSPQVTVNGSTEVCLGSNSPQVSFTGSTGVAPYTFTYNINGGANITAVSNGNTAILNAPTTTVGTFVYNLVGVTEAGNSCAAAVIGNATVIVHDLPQVNAGADVDVCLNNPITLTASGAVTYAWVPSIINGTAFTPTSSGTYSVTGTDANGCVNTDALELTVNVPVLVDAGPDQVICIGDNVTLSGIISDPSASIVWTNGVVNNIAFAPSQTNQYTVTSTDVNGCLSTDVVNVIVNELPDVNAGANISGCAGDEYTFTGSGAGPNGVYVWTHGIVNGVPIVPAAGNYYVAVVGTDHNGCVNGDSLMVKIDSIPLPTFTVVVDQNCAPVTATFYNTTVPAGVNCIWTFDNGSTVNGCGPVTQVFDYPGSYGASLQIQTPVNACVGTMYLADVVVVDALPVAHFVPNPQTGTQVQNQIVFHNQSYGATSYVWDFGDGSPASSAANPVHSYGEEIDIYTVTLIAVSQAGCRDTAYSTVQILEEIIYYIPNTFTPDADQFNETFKPIFTYGFDPFDYTLEIFNRWGEIIFESHNVEIGWNGRYGVDGNLCQDGTYTWKIEVKTSKNDERKTFTGHVNLLR